ncbi:MAG: DivIVA domain-containing protein [Bacillota bacterium]
MALTPLDIHNKEFGRSFRGYNEEEVDEFLDEVVRDFETLYKENANLKEMLATRESNIGQYKDLEDTLKKTLVVAQQTAEDIKVSASREAEVILQEARLKAEQLIAAAEEKGQEIVRNYENLQKQAQHLRVKLRSFLQSQLALVEEKESLLAVDDEQQKSLTGDEANLPDRVAMDEAACAAEETSTE